VAAVVVEGHSAMGTMYDVVESDVAWVSFGSVQRRPALLLSQWFHAGALDVVDVVWAARFCRGCGVTCKEISGRRLQARLTVLVF
jgi:hypothetical protein